MNKSVFKQLIKEVVVQTIKEFIGPKPSLGQKYFKVTVIQEWNGNKQTVVWPSVLANDEEDAKSQVTSSINLKVVKIHDIQAIPSRDVDQSDIDQYDKDASYYSNALRPKSQGGYGSN